MTERIPLLTRLARQAWLPDALSLTGWSLFAWRLWQAAQTRQTVLDEGAYLLKGYLFATGQYAPFQYNGPWTNQMPLAFLIPGLVLRLFGPSLRIGRGYAIFLAALALIGLWLLARRFGGRWAAAAAVWIVAWNPVQAKMYSLAVSQPLVACLLIWIAVLVLGRRRPPWQVLLGSALAGMLILVRINLTPVLPLLVLYIFWEHGRRLGWSALTLGTVIAIVGHLPYWPEILQMWAGWIPRSLTPFLDEWRVPAGLLRRWNPDPSPDARLMSFFTAWRVHFSAYSGALAALLLWPETSAWKDAPLRRLAIWLTTFFWLMALAHIAVTIFGSYCIFCLESYSAFYGLFGILLMVITFPYWRRQPGLVRQLLIGIALIILSAGILFSNRSEVAPILTGLKLPVSLLGLAGWEKPSIQLGKYLELRFNWEPEFIRRFLSAAAGAALATGLILLSILVSALWSRESRRFTGRPTPRPLYLALVAFLLLGIALAPPLWLNGSQDAYDCAEGTLDAIEAAGRDLAARIPPGSLVYWHGGKSIVPLLYVPGIRLFPQQMEGDYSYYLGGDREQLLRLGLMNVELDAEWLAQADYLLIEERLYRDWLQAAPPLPEFDELAPTPPTAPCYPGSEIHVFKRLGSP